MKDRLLFTSTAVLLLVLALSGAVAAGTWTLSDRFSDHQIEGAEAGGITLAEGSYVPSGVGWAVSTLRIPAEGVSLMFRHGWTVPPDTLPAGSVVTTRLSVTDQGSRLARADSPYLFENEGSTAMEVDVTSDEGALDSLESLTSRQLDGMASVTMASGGLSVAPGQGPLTKDVTWTVPEGTEGSHLVITLGGEAASQVLPGTLAPAGGSARPAVSGATFLVYRYSAQAQPVTADWNFVIGALIAGAVIGGVAVIFFSRRGRRRPGQASPPVAADPGTAAGSSQSAQSPQFPRNTCTGCGKPFAPGAKFCPACGTGLPGAPGGPEAPAGNQCPACGKEYVAGRKFCSACGVELPGEVKLEENGCPSCGRQVKPGSRYCSSCGRKMGEG